MTMLDKNVRCWNCKNPWHECLGECLKYRVPYVSAPKEPNANDTLEKQFRELAFEVERLHVELMLKKEALNRLGRQLERNPEPLPVKELGWVKIHQNAPCWRCDKPTEWRNPYGKAEHRHCQLTPRIVRDRRLDSILDGLLNGSINPDDLL